MSARLMILVVLGVANGVQSALSLLVLLGENFTVYQGWVSNLLWLLPALSFPNFLVYLRFHRFGAFMAWLISLCIVAHFFDFKAYITHQPHTVTNLASFTLVLLICVFVLCIPTGMQFMSRRAYNQSSALI